MNSKDVVKALKCCSEYLDTGLCEECPLFGDEDCGKFGDEDCGKKVLLDAAKTIEELERQLEELKQQLNYGKEAMDVLVQENLTMEKKLAELGRGRAPCAG